MVTEEQYRILTYIDAYSREHGHPPSYAEIAAANGIPTVGHVHYRVNRLEQAGYLTRVPKQARSLKVLRLPAPPAGMTVAAGGRTVRWRLLRRLREGVFAAVRSGYRRVMDGLSRAWLWLLSGLRRGRHWMRRWLGAARQPILG